VLRPDVAQAQRGEQPVQRPAVLVRQHEELLQAAVPVLVEVPAQAAVLALVAEPAQDEELALRAGPERGV